MLTLTLTAICWATTAHAARSWEQRPHGPPPDELTVPTTSGHVAGKIDPEYPNVRQFLGIPFAEAPVGERRWAAPEPLSQPDAWVDARRLPPSCPQFLTSTGQSAYTREFLEFNLQGLNRTGDISEDCLTLSVWTPTEEECERGRGGEPDALSGGLPVFIYIYGGSFSTGGQDVPYQIPTQWVSRSPDHIVVSFNYRVNIFGHPGNPQLERNPGLLDQRLAVEWVKENIAHFGGDPTKMVLWGQSAGSASVDFYNFAYPEDPIVSGLIMDSGTALLPIRGDPSGRNFSHVASQVGCPGLADNPSEEIACMRKVDALKIESFIANYSDSGTSPGLSFGPVPDEKTVFANYTARALDGKQAQIPAIIGTNRDDGVPFTSGPYNASGPYPVAAERALLRIFLCPVTQTIRMRQQTGRLTYRFVYSGNFSNISPRPWLGAYHSSELPLVFGTHPNYRGPSTELEYSTSHVMQDAWGAYAADPVDGLSSSDWQPYDVLGSIKVREFGNGVAAQDISIASLETRCDGGRIAT